jgi:hypothetical protein
VETRVVEIVWAHDPETDGPDLDEIGKRYELSKKEARELVNSGAARYTDIPRDEVGRSLADMNSRVVLNELRRHGLPELPSESKSAMVARIQQHLQDQQAKEAAADLDKLTVAELRDQYPAADAMPANTKKAKLIQAIRDAETADSGEPVEADSGESVPDAEVDGSGGGIVTVAPGAEHNPDRDQTVQP